MPSTIQFGYAGLSVAYDPAGPLSLLDLLAAAREVRATLDAAEASPARPTGAGTRPGRNAAPAAPPATCEEAERRFYARYGEAIGGTTWQAVQRYLGHLLPRPGSIEAWYAVAEEIRDRQRAAA